MQETTVSALRPGMPFAGDLLVRSVDKRTGKTGRDYLDMTLCDRTGEINAKVWNLDGLPGIPVASGVVWLEGSVEEFNGRIQMRVNKLKPATDPDLRKLIPCAPEPASEMMLRIEETVDSFASEDLKALVREMIRLTGDTLEWFPAAQRMHHAERSGLLHHTTSMMNTAEHICEAYPFLNRDLLLAGVIVHDLGKTAELKSDKLGNVSDYTADGLLIGHLVRGVTLVDEAARNVGVSGELVTLLEHMMISHHGIPEFGSPRRPLFPEAEVLHWIDTLDAKMDEMKTIQDRTPAGAFSERIAYLDDRRMYHPVFTADPPVPPKAAAEDADGGLPR